MHLLKFADDMVIVAPSQRALQLKINQLEKFCRENCLIVNLTKTQVVVFRRGGRLPKDIIFTYKGLPIKIVNEYTYLGVTFSSSCLFRKAAEKFKTKGMSALGSLWPILFKGKVENWDSHYQLFSSIAMSTVLYASHIWGYPYADIIEQVQTRFLKRIFHLDNRVANYAIRMETSCTKLLSKIAKQMINFYIKVQLMDESRIAYKCMKALLVHLKPGQELNKYNWTSYIRDILAVSNSQDLMMKPGAILSEKQRILLDFTDFLRNNDTMRAQSSLKHHYCHSLQEENRLINLVNMPLAKLRLVAQTRLNNGRFYFRRHQTILGASNLLGSEITARRPVDSSCLHPPLSASWKLEHMIGNSDLLDEM
ncbi:hypothetical protein Fcan01_23014 [Folsomia candida]|uniref:Reverse transcriptase domain-containing protein n=1 Tax=Folsomia candida TaxID=158441 RepID=A0A226DDF5_FOLCA|nr:hypothetical protein Fcan01_23014 [Folsomia candida]